MSLRVENRKILILGASSDIGLKTLDLFLAKNWKVFAHYNKNNKNLLKFKKNGENIELIKFDFKNINNIEKKIKKSFYHGYHSIINLIGYIDNKSFLKTYWDNKKI